MLDMRVRVFKMTGQILISWLPCKISLVSWRRTRLKHSWTGNHVIFSRNTGFRQVLIQSRIMEPFWRSVLKTPSWILDNKPKYSWQYLARLISKVFSEQPMFRQVGAFSSKLSVENQRHWLYVDVSGAYKKKSKNLILL